MEFTGELRNVPIADINTETFNRWRGENYNDANLDELAQSILSNGLLHPIVVAEDEEGGIHLVSGGRRLAAIQKIMEQAAEEEQEFMPEGIPCRIGTGDEGEIKAAVISENLQREDPNMDSIAEGVMDLLSTDGWNGKMVAESMGKSPAWVTQCKNYCEKVAPEIRAQVRRGELSFSSALNLKNAGDAKAQQEALKEAKKEAEKAGKKLSSREVKDKVEGDEVEKASGEKAEGKRASLKKLLLSKQFMVEKLADARAKQKAIKEGTEEADPEATEKLEITIARYAGYIDALRGALGEKDLIIPEKKPKAKKGKKGKVGRPKKEAAEGEATSDGEKPAKKIGKAKMKKNAKKAGKVGKKIVKTPVSVPDED